MKPRILMVDDEKNILEAYVRNLHEQFDITKALSGAEALAALETTSFPVIVSDYKMPEMDGVELLEQVRERSPDTVQIMLTGQADMQAIVDLINRGKIFRFLTKPCSSETLASNICDALRQYELITAERELLGKTLGGSIKVLTDLLALAKPQVFNQSVRIRNLSRKIYRALNIRDSWKIEIAALLSQIGCVTMPDSVLKTAYQGLTLSEDEALMFNNHPIIAADMIANIPRMEAVAEIIRYQEKRYDGKGVPADNLSGEGIPLGARILKVANDYARFLNQGMEDFHAIYEMKKRPGVYDPKIMDALESVMKNEGEKNKAYVTKHLLIKQLQEGMYLAEDVVTASGVVIGNKNQPVTRALIVTLTNHATNQQIKQPIQIITKVE
jgi:response regulator RpfG family c-di-GMP phosphodiesterase